MDDVTDALRVAFEAAGYDIEGVSENRGRIRITVREESAPATDLRTIAHDVCGAEAVVGFDVSTEATAGEEAVGTVVSFRYRP